MTEAQSNPIQRPAEGRAGFTPLRRALSALVLLLTFNLRAAIQFDVTVGIEGYIPEASWFPIVCEVNNDGPSFQGVIEVASGGFGQSLTRQVTVELPTGTRKIITIPVFSSSAYGNWDVKLKDSAGRLRAETGSIRPNGYVKRGTILVGTLSRMPSWKPSFLPLPPNRNEWQAAAGRFLRPIDLPDNAIVLEGMDALYLNSEKAGDLKSQQAAAVESWINSGGHLIVAVEQISDINNLPWLRRLVPMELNGATSLSPGTALDDWLRSPVSASKAQDAAFRTYNSGGRQSKTNISLQTPFANTQNQAAFNDSQLNIATGKLRENGRIIAAIGDTPLIASTQHGNGRVSVLLFSPEREPFKSWRNQPTFWSRLTGVPARLFIGNDSFYSSAQGTDGIFGAMIDSRQVRKLPIWQLLLMLLAYLAVIGPVDQIWLRKIGKPMLTWITFPCYVALFSGLIYLVGYKLRAGETEWNEIHVVDLFPSGQKMEQRGHTYGSIYSPVNDRYNFECAARAAAFRSEFAGNMGGNEGSERGRIVQTENSFKAEVFVPVWTCQLYASDWLQSTEAPFFATVKKSGSSWAISIQNKLGKPLTHVRFVANNRVYDLDDVPAGQTRQFTPGINAAGSSLHDFVNRYGNTFEGVISQRRNAFGSSEGGRLENLPDSSAAVSFLANRQGPNEYYTFLPPPTLDLSAAAEGDSAILLAWTASHSPLKPMNQFNTRHSSANTLWRMTLPLTTNP